MKKAVLLYVPKNLRTIVFALKLKLDLKFKERLLVTFVFMTGLCSCAVYSMFERFKCTVTFCNTYLSGSIKGTESADLSLTRESFIIKAGEKDCGFV